MRQHDVLMKQTGYCPSTLDFCVLKKSCDKNYFYIVNIDQVPTISRENELDNMPVFLPKLLLIGPKQCFDWAERN